MAVLRNSITLPEQIAWTYRQLVRSGAFPDEAAALRSALRALFQVNPKAKLAFVASAYRDGEISLGKASELLGVSQEEMKEILVESGESLHFGPQDRAGILSDAANA